MINQILFNNMSRTDELGINFFSTVKKKNKNLKILFCFCKKKMTCHIILNNLLSRPLITSKQLSSQYHKSVWRAFPIDQAGLGICLKQVSAEHLSHWDLP